MRRTADRLIVHNPHQPRRVRSRALALQGAHDPTRSASGCGGTSSALLRSLDPAKLPSASPLKRPAARGRTELFARLAARLGDERPVAARGMLLAQSLLHDATSPLFADDADTLLAPALRRVTGALEP